MVDYPRSERLKSGSAGLVVPARPFETQQLSKAYMEKYISYLCLSILLLLMVFRESADAVTSSVPDPSTFDTCADVRDYLTAEQEVSIENACGKLKTDRNVSAVVYVDDTLTLMTEEEFADGLAESWKLGQDSDGRWVVVAVFVNDRKMRLGCSENLDGKLTYRLSKNIIDTRFAPEFKKGNYRKGILDGLNAIDLALANKPAASSGSKAISFFSSLVSDYRFKTVAVVLLLLFISILVMDHYNFEGVSGDYGTNRDHEHYTGTGGSGYGGGGGGGCSGGGGGGGSSGGGGATGGW